MQGTPWRAGHLARQRLRPLPKPQVQAQGIPSERRHRRQYLDVTTSPGLAVLTRLEDGRIRVDRADPIITISADLLEQADRESMVIDRDIVKFGDINPTTYRITERHPRHVVAVKADTAWHRRAGNGTQGEQGRLSHDTTDHSRSTLTIDTDRQWTDRQS